MANNWWTSDLHLGHKTVIGYSKRPFLFDESAGWDDPANFDVVRMDQTIEDNWNATVAPEDHVYLLGDVMFGPDYFNRVAALRARLNGSITLVLGNHDRSAAFYLRAGFDSVVRSVWLQISELEGGYLPGFIGRCETYVPKHNIYMSHKPPVRPTVDHDQYDVILHGHLHEVYRRRGKLINVGVDQWGFRPVSLDELLACPADNKSEDEIESLLTDRDEKR